MVQLVFELLLLVDKWAKSVTHSKLACELMCLFSYLMMCVDLYF